MVRATYPLIFRMYRSHAHRHSQSRSRTAATPTITLRMILRTLRFDRARGLWTALGDATEVRRTDERKAILDALRESCDPLSPFQGPVSMA